MTGGNMELIRKHKNKILTAMAVAIVMVMVLLPFSSGIGQSSSPMTASIQASPQVSAAISTGPVALSTGINVSSIFSSIWGLITGFAKGILNDVETLIGTIFSGFGNAVSVMFANWANSLYGLGIWAPVIFVIVLALAGFMLYFFLDTYGIERDFLHGEEDI